MIQTASRYTYQCETCSDAEEKMIPKMQSLLNQFVDSSCMEKFFLNTKLVQTDGRSNAEVVKHIRASSVHDIPLIFYTPKIWQSKNVIGYTIDGEPEIYLNRSFRRDSAWGICAEVSNEFHETLHKIGYEHDFEATSRRPNSVPYKGNRAVEACCDDEKGIL